LYFHAFVDAGRRNAAACDARQLCVSVPQWLIVCVSTALSMTSSTPLPAAQIQTSGRMPVLA
jgi:hypothetical protein